MSERRHRFVLLDVERERYYEGDSIQELQNQIHGIVKAGRDIFDTPRATMLMKVFLRALR